MNSKAKVWANTISIKQVSSAGEPIKSERISNIGDIEKPHLEGCMSYMQEDYSSEKLSYIGVNEAQKNKVYGTNAGVFSSRVGFTG